MHLAEHVQLMAQYNESMNVKIYETAATLLGEELSRNQGAFFGSVIGTLNHIAVGDIIWLKRFSVLLQSHHELDVVRAMSQPQSLDSVLCSTLPELYEYRKVLDKTIVKLAGLLSEAELCLIFNYTNSKGVTSNKKLFSVLMHFFNHQTHHRGQATTLLSQFGRDVGVTDLVAIIPNV